MTEIDWWVYPVVLAGLVFVSWLLHVVVLAIAAEGSDAKRHGMRALFIGVDNRTSTSKLQAFLWTYAILWALVSLLAGAGIDEFHDALDSELREEYLLLLGGPYAAAIAAKAITTQRADKDVQAKTPKPAQDGGGLTERLAEVVTNDEGNVDLGDFQYFAFTVLTLTYFAWAFIDAPGDGLPDIPGTLLVLVGVSQGAYVGKKGLLR